MAADRRPPRRRAGPGRPPAFTIYDLHDDHLDHPGESISRRAARLDLSRRTIARLTREMKRAGLVGDPWRADRLLEVTSRPLAAAALGEIKLAQDRLEAYFNRDEFPAPLPPAPLSGRLTFDQKLANAR